MRKTLSTKPNSFKVVYLGRINVYLFLKSLKYIYVSAFIGIGSKLHEAIECLRLEQGAVSSQSVANQPGQQLCCGERLLHQLL